MPTERRKVKRHPPAVFVGGFFVSVRRQQDQAGVGVASERGNVQRRAPAAGGLGFCVGAGGEQHLAGCRMPPFGRRMQRRASAAVILAVRVGAGCKEIPADLNLAVLRRPVQWRPPTGILGLLLGAGRQKRDANRGVAESRRQVKRGGPAAVRVGLRPRRRRFVKRK